jgi:putative Ca2+/H+ antiporter (TMEM165/GDT1 family)
VVQVGTLIFVAEWGDRSMLATIAFAASHPPVGKQPDTYPRIITSAIQGAEPLWYLEYMHCSTLNEVLFTNGVLLLYTERCIYMAGVALGATLAHAVATAIAVASGSIASQYVSEKTIGYIGGTLFLVFSVLTFFGYF